MTEIARGGIPEIPVGTCVEEYTIVEKVGAGKNCVVYKVKKGEQGMYALKAGGNQFELDVELEVMEAMKFEKLFPKMEVTGRHGKFKYVVTTLLGPDLQSLCTRSPNTPWSKGTWSRIGIQGLFAIKSLHDSGWVHRNINPSNFAMGTDTKNCRLVQLFSLGTATQFIQKLERPEIKDGRTPREDLIPRRLHCKTEPEFIPECRKIPREKFMPWRGPIRKAFVPPRAHVDPCGTPGLMSLNACQGKEQGRCDDVWSFLYTLVLFVGELPWMREEKKVPFEHLSLRQLFTTYTKLQLNEPQLKQLDDIEKMLKACDYYSFPDYQMIYELLHSVMKESDVSWNDTYDWEQKDEMWRQALREPPNISHQWKHPGNYFKSDRLCSVLRLDTQ